MLKSLKFIVSMVVVLGICAGVVYALEADFSGFVDITYNYDANNPLSRTTALRSYDSQTNTMLLNAVHMALTGELEEGVGYTVEADFGSDAALNTPGGSGDSDDFDLQEAYLTYRMGRGNGIDLTVGKFVTLEGIEVIESPDNINISRGFLYGLVEPFTHTGVKLDYGMNDWMSMTLGVVNGWDLSSDNNNGKTGIWRIGFDFGDPLSFGISGTYGPEKPNNDADNRTSVDLTGSTKLCSFFSIAFQGNYGEEDNVSIVNPTHPGQWVGFGIQPQLTMGDLFSIGGRYEHLNDDDGARTGALQSLNTVAVTPAIQLNKNTIVRFEYRHDWSNRKVFEDDKGVFKEDSTDTGMIEFIYTF